MLNALQDFLTSFWRWYSTDPEGNFLGLLFALGWIGKPLFASWNLFRKTGETIPEDFRLSRGEAATTTMLLLADDWGSTIILLSTWLFNPFLLNALGIDHPLAQRGLLIIGMLFYGGWKYMYSRRSLIVMFAAVLDDGVGLAAFLMATKFLAGVEPLQAETLQLMNNLQAVFGQ